MELLPNAINHLSQHKRRYDRFYSYFNDFVTHIELLTGPNSGISGLNVQSIPAQKAVDVTYLDVTMRCKFLTAVRDGGLIGYIAFFRTISEPNNENQIYLGRVEFNGSGISNIEVQPGRDPIHISEEGIQIMLSFLSMALEERILQLTLQPA